MDYIADSKKVLNQAKGVCFTVRGVAKQASSFPAFIVRFHQRTYAYLNRCAHRALPLNLEEGVFFTEDGCFLMCAMHGAVYAPDTGACVGGMCQGVGLHALQIEDDGEKIYLKDARFTVV